MGLCRAYVAVMWGLNGSHYCFWTTTATGRMMNQHVEEQSHDPNSAPTGQTVSNYCGVQFLVLVMKLWASFWRFCVSKLLYMQIPSSLPNKS